MKTLTGSPWPPEQGRCLSESGVSLLLGVGSPVSPPYCRSNFFSPHGLPMAPMTCSGNSRTTCGWSCHSHVRNATLSVPSLSLVCEDPVLKPPAPRSPSSPAVEGGAGLVTRTRRQSLHHGLSPLHACRLHCLCHMNTPDSASFTQGPGRPW